MRPPIFLIASVLGFILLAAAYALLIDRVVIPQRTVPFPYSQFLLEASASIDGKVVIDSGSNSFHGIDTSILADYFQAPVIIVADGASYPLRNKIFRLKKYLRKGDVLILPLEWTYYTRQDALPTSFLSLIADKNLSLEYYFNDLPVTEKMRFIFTQYPLKIALESLEVRDSALIQRSNTERLEAFVSKLNVGDNESFGGSLRDGPEDIDKQAARFPCDRYTSPRKNEAGTFAISDVFRSDLALLQELSRSGITVHFSWPSVVDSVSSACHQGPRVQAQLEKYATEIVALIEAEGFKFVGDLKDSYFTAECFLNTYHHLRYSCAQERTNRLVEALQRDDVAPLNSSHTPDDLVREAIGFAGQKRRELVSTSSPGAEQAPETYATDPQ